MNINEQFYDAVKGEMAVMLATSDGKKVSMRVVSPVLCGKSILIFTSAASRKYRDLQANPNCCVSVRSFFVECTAEFLGATMTDDNKSLRDLYMAKFSGAFDEGVEFGGRSSEFILLKPNRLSGWAFEDGAKEGSVPTVPFDVAL